MYTLQSISVQENIKVWYQMPVPWTTLGPLLELDATSSSQVLPYRRTVFRELSENYLWWDLLHFSWRTYLQNYLYSSWHFHLHPHQSLEPNVKLQFSEMQNLCFRFHLLGSGSRRLSPERWISCRDRFKSELHKMDIEGSLIFSFGI